MSRGQPYRNFKKKIIQPRTVGEWVYKCRTEAEDGQGMTQRELSRLASDALQKMNPELTVSQSYVGVLERDAVSELTHRPRRVSREIIQAIAQVTSGDAVTGLMLAGYLPDEQDAAVVAQTNDGRTIISKDGLPPVDLSKQGDALAEDVKNHFASVVKTQEEADALKERILAILEGRK